MNSNKEVKKDGRVNNRRPPLPEKLAAATLFQLKESQLERIKQDANTYGISAAAMLRFILDEYYQINSDQN